jgi:membrane-associated protease RseP (regulator of RpoE activity)
MHFCLGMRVWLSLTRFGGVMLALGLFASASATAASTAAFEVEPANPLGARDALEGADVPAGDGGELARRKRAREAAVATILGRNPFCEDCPAATPGVSATPGTAPLPPGAAPPVAVLATMESSDPALSLATVYDPATGTRLVGVGDSLGTGFAVASIGPGAVTYSYGGRTGVLNVGTPVEAPAPATAPAAPRVPEKPSDPMMDRVKCDAGSRCTIERTLISDLLANPRALGGLRALPSNGGFRLSGIRRGTLAHKLGLRNGDVLTEVGGKPLASIDDALSLLPLLKSATNVHVTLSRKGKPVTHEIEIV